MFITPVFDPNKIGVSPVNTTTRMLWLALMLLFGLVIGVAAGIIDWAGGTNPFLAVEHAAGSFAGVLALLLAIYYFVTR
jgi:hypothetical protein